MDRIRLLVSREAFRLNAMNNRSSLFDYLFKDRRGEEVGQRTEAIVTLGLGFLSTALAVFAYSNPIVLLASAITNFVALFTLIQAIRGKFNYLILFPVVTAFAILVVTTVEGDGVHDLLWMGLIGLFLLANVYSRRNSWPAVLLGILMLLLFVTAGFAEVTNVVPNRFNTSIKYIVLNSFFFLTIMSAIMAVFHRQRILLASEVRNRSEQIETNRQLEEINQTLENQVAARSNELNKLNEQLQIKAARLQTSSEISQELMANIEDKPNELLSRAARLISKKLGFYHVGIFLVDDSREFAVLRASNSKGGQQMLSRHHQLKVGGTGIVGYVALTGRPRITLDTSSDAVFFNNPDLPETRSEISLPLKYGKSILGVLDVQSTHPSAFGNDDIDTLSTLANQVAIIIRNTQIAEENRFISSKSIKFTHKEMDKGYTYRIDGSITTVTELPENNPALKKALASGEAVTLSQPPKEVPPTLAVPVKLREQVIGIIHIESSQAKRAWTDDEVAFVQAVSDRAALALDNARLLEESQRRAAKEHAIGEISARIGTSTDVDTILRTAVRELGAQISGAQVTLEIGDGKQSR